MNTTTPLAGRTRPLVALVCSIPLLSEGVGSALEFAEVQSFSDRGGDIAGLLRWLVPDVVVVDSETGADDAVPYALEHTIPLLHISVKDGALRLFRDGAWHQIGGAEATPESVRNVVAGALFAREGRLQ